MSLGTVTTILLYESVSQLSAETSYVPFGTLAFITGARQFAMAQYATSGADVTTSTSKDAQGHTQTIYWTNIVTTG